MQALRKEPLTVYGDGKQTRSFQYVSDLVSTFYLTFLWNSINKTLFLDYIWCHILKETKLISRLFGIMMGLLKCKSYTLCMFEIIIGFVEVKKCSFCRITLAYCNFDKFTMNLNMPSVDFSKRIAVSLATYCELWYQSCLEM